MPRATSDPVKIGPVRVSYPTVFTPKAMNDRADAKYSITLCFDKADQAQMAQLKGLADSVNKVRAEAWPDPSKRPQIPTHGHDKSPIKDIDTACNQENVPLLDKNPELAGHYIVRCTSPGSSPMPVLDQQKDPIEESDGKIFGGCWCNVIVNCYSYDTNGNRGVTFGFSGVQLVKKDDPFGGGYVDPDEFFDVMDVDGIDADSFTSQPDPLSAAQDDAFDSGGQPRVSGSSMDPLDDDDAPF